MNLNDDSRLQIEFEVDVPRDPTGSTVTLKVGESSTTWNAASWIGTPTLGGTTARPRWTQTAETVGFFAGPAVLTGDLAGATVLPIGRHSCEARLVWPDGERRAFFIGVVDVT